MYKRRLILLFLFGNFALFGQKKYICEYSDTTTAILPDSILAEMLTSARPDVEIPAAVMHQFLLQMKQKPMFMAQQRIVRAGIDQTVISIDRRSKNGNLSMETFDSILYKGDEIFPDSSSATGFTLFPLATQRKEFLSTGNTILILNYKCNEYVSNDSTCRIWITTQLPDYLNPGIRKGNIKGAVLGFELKGNITITKCILERFGRGL